MRARGHAHAHARAPGWFLSAHMGRWSQWDAVPCWKEWLLQAISWRARMASSRSTAVLVFAGCVLLDSSTWCAHMVGSGRS